MIVLGIDLGVNGAIAIIENGAIVQVHDMPTLKDGPAGRRTINAPLLAELLASSHATMAYVETVGVRPGEGPVGAFAFGRARGTVEGALAALGIRCQFIGSPQWKRFHGIPPGKDGTKDAARSKAIARWPDRASMFARVKDDGRAESCLIAIAGMTLVGGERARAG